MINFLTIHHYLAFFTLILLVIISGYILYVRSFSFGSVRLIRALSMFTVVSLHTQAFLGLVLMINILSTLQDNDVSLGSIIRDPLLRYRVLEHPFMMLLAVILATLAHVRLKKEVVGSKAATLFVLALVVLLTRLPFDQMFN